MFARTRKQYFIESCNPDEKTLVPLDVLIFTSKFYQQYSQYRVTYENLVFLKIFYSIITRIIIIHGCWSTFVPISCSTFGRPGYLATVVNRDDVHET